MTFLKVRLHSIFAAAFIVAILLPQWSGNLFAQTVTNLAELNTAIKDVATATGTVNIVINNNINLNGEILELYVPAGVTVNISGTGTIDGDGTHRGLVIQTATGTSNVNISGITFRNCVATGGDGGDGAVGGGGGAGLGAAIYVRGTDGNVSLTDVTFRNNTAQGGDGGSVINGSTTAGGGGGLGGDGGGDDGNSPAGNGVYVGGGGGGFGQNATGGTDNTGLDGGDGTTHSSTQSGDGYSNVNTSQAGNGGIQGGGGGGAYGTDSLYAAGGGGGEGGTDATKIAGNLWGGDGGYGGGGGGSTEYGGDGGFGGGGGAGNTTAGNGGFGGGGGGSLNNNKAGDGGYGAGDGGMGGGGGLGAGGDLYVEGNNVTVSVNYTTAYNAASTSTLFGSSTAIGGTGGNGAGNGDGLGAIFLNGNNVTFGGINAADIMITGNISDISAASNFNKTNTADLQAHAGGIVISGTGASVVTLKGNNTYAGVTQIDSGATLVADGTTITDANGKRISNAIGDLSEVQIAGNLYLNKDETIGFLSGNGNVYLHDNTTGNVGGKTLIIAGDEDPNQFGLGINPATGLPVAAFSGSILTDGDAMTAESLIKTGTGRLTLSGNSSNTGDEFTTTIYQGTIVLDHAAGLGNGSVTVRNIDMGTGSKLRNVIEAGASLTGAVLNNFQIATSGKDLDGTQRTFNDFVIGGANDIQFGNGTTTTGGGQISGGNILVNMDAATNQVILANTGFNGMTSLAANLNNYGETRIKNGTVVVNPYTLTSGVIGDTLGNGSVRAFAMEAGDTAILSAAINNMLIDNNLVFDEGSKLTLSNETAVTTGYTLSGNTSGKGGMIVGTTATATNVTMTGMLAHTGATHIENGTLNITPPGGRALLYNLSASVNGTLNVTSGDLYVNIKEGDTAIYSGTINMPGLGTNQTLYKTGNGTWVFDRGGAVINAVNVNTGALQLNQNGDVQNITLSGSGELIVNDNVTLVNLNSERSSTNVTINGSNTLILKSSGTATDHNTLHNTWTGGTGATVEFHGNTRLYNVLQNGTVWNGTMVVGNGIAGATLTVASPGAMGNPTEAQVTLKEDSKLVIDTYVNGYYPTVEQIKQLNIAGNNTTVDTEFGSTLATGTIAGSYDVTKDGGGTWAMLGDSVTGHLFTGDIDLAGGTIHLQRTQTAPGTYSYGANMGEGTLNVTETGTSLKVDVGNTAKTIGNDIDLTNTLNIYVTDYSTNGSSVNFTGSISGAGGVDYRGTGTMVLNGAGVKDYSGPTNIYGGTLQVDVNTVTDYFVNNGGTLALNGISTNSGSITVNNGGTLTGTGTNTTGVLTFNSGSLLIIDGSGNIKYDANGNNVNIQDGAIAHITGSSGGNITGFITTSGLGTISGSHWFTDEIQGQRAIVTPGSGTSYDITFVPVDYMSNTQSVNGQNFGGYLSAVADNSINGQSWGANHSIPINTQTSLLLNNLENVTPAMYDYALLEVGGQINPSMVTAQKQTTSNMFQSITKQLHPLEQFTGENRGMVRAQSMRSGWTGWSNTLGIYGDTSGSGQRGTFGYDFQTFGMSIGFEPTSAMAVNRLGMFYAYNYTDIDTNQSIGSGQIKSNFFGTYGRFVDSMGYTSFVAGFGFDDYKSNRSVLVPTMGGDSQSKFDGWQGGFYVERGLNQSTMTQFGLQPYVGLQYLHLNTDDFAETGSNQYKLITESADADSLQTNLGVRFARQVARVKRGSMHVTGNVSWMHEFLDADCQMTSRWAASNNPSTFGVRGNSLGRDWAVFGAGIDWSLRQNLSIFGSCDLQVNGYQTLSVANAGARIQW